MKPIKMDSRPGGSARHLHLSVWGIFRWGWHRIDWVRSIEVDSTV